MATVHPNPSGPVLRLAGGSPAVNPGMQNVSQSHLYSLDIQANANTTDANILPHQLCKQGPSHQLKLLSYQVEMPIK